MRTYFLPERIPKNASKAEELQARLFNLIVDMSHSEEEIIPMVQSCLHAGANPNHCGNESLLAVALREGRYLVARVLLERGARLDLVLGGSSRETQFSVFHECMWSFQRTAAETGEVEGLRLLLQYATKYQFNKFYGPYSETPYESLTDFLDCLRASHRRSPKLSAAQREQLIGEITELVEAHFADIEAAQKSQFSLGSMASHLVGFFSSQRGYAALPSDEASAAKKTA